MHGPIGVLPVIPDGDVPQGGGTIDLDFEGLGEDAGIAGRIYIVVSGHGFARAQRQSLNSIGLALHLSHSGGFSNLTA